MTNPKRLHSTLPGEAPYRAFSLDGKGVSFGELGAEALVVQARLREAGHEAYLVGGCVRDLLLGLQPKDFDVATSAAPETVHALFRRSRIIGRRFQIVHVRAGREIIEVSTFRGHHSPDFGSEGEEDVPESASAVHAESGMLLRDNVFGTVEQDALRRDFTINGLYYDPQRNLVLDFNTGIPDLRARLLRVIGDPVKRYQEDPVRMLRAVRFAAKLDFAIEKSALAAIDAHHKLLAGIPAARMFDEVLKLLLSGKGERTFALLERHGLYAMLFPQTARAILRQPQQRELLIRALHNTDERISQGKPVTPAFLFAAMLWPALCEKLDGAATHSAILEATQEVIRAQTACSTLPRRFATPMREIWDLQPRLIARRQVERLLSHPRFRAAYDFILLREQAGESLDQVGQWWTRLQAGEVDVEPPQSQPPPRRRRRRSRRPGHGEQG